MIRIFKRYIPTWFLGLGVAELLVFACSVYLGELTRYIGEPEFHWQVGTDSHIAIAMFPPLMITNVILVGLYDRQHLEEGRAGGVLRILISFVFVVIEIALFNLALPGFVPWRRSLATALVLSFLGVLLVRYSLFARFVDDLSTKRRVLVLGAGAMAQHILDIVEHRGSGYAVVGCIPLSGEPVIVNPNYHVQIDMPIRDFVFQNEIDEIVVATTERRLNLPMADLLDCKFAGIEISESHVFCEKYTGRVMLDGVYPSWFIYSDGFRGGSLSDFAKRVFDVTVATGLLLATLPIFLFTAAAIYLEDGRRVGSILYRQKRVGINGRTFDCLKFRSMRHDAEADGVARWAAKGDDRVTRVGAFIRKTRIDELPQIFNVLKGDMSFVGPRPERPEFVGVLSQHIPYYVERHRVRPGITGWAQVRYEYGASDEDAAEKLKYDLYYVKHFSLFLDLLIILRTVEVVLAGKGAR